MPGRLHLSTATLPEAERFDIWRELYGRAIFNVEIEPIGEQPFSADATLCMLPDVGIVSGWRGAAHYRVTPAMTGNASEGVLLSTVRSGIGIGRQRGNELTLGPGQTLFAASSDPGKWTLPTGGTFQTVRVSRRLISALAPNFEDLIGRQVVGSGRALQLLSSYAEIVQQTDIAGDDTLAHAAASHIADLMALVIGSSGEVAELAKGRGVRAARLATIKAHIKANIGRAPVSLASVAAAHGVSRRYVQMLFEEEGVTFTSFFNAQRLVFAYRVLTDPAKAGQRIGELAYDLGFQDLSTFHRLFKRQFGATPSEVRNEHRRDGSAVMR